MVVFNPLKFWGGDAQRKTVDSLWLWHISMGTKLPLKLLLPGSLGMVVLCAQVLGPYRGWLPDTVVSRAACGDSGFSRASRCVCI